MHVLGDQMFSLDPSKLKVGVHKGIFVVTKFWRLFAGKGEAVGLLGRLTT